MKEKYRLAGFLNLLDIRPGFVYPVFENRGKLYFQDGENDRIKEFVEVKKSVTEQIIPLDDDRETIITEDSRPVYAYQRYTRNIYYGNSADMIDYLQKIPKKSENLENEIEMFKLEVQQKEDRDETAEKPGIVYIDDIVPHLRAAARTTKGMAAKTARGALQPQRKKGNDQGLITLEVQESRRSQYDGIRRPNTGRRKRKEENDQGLITLEVQESRRNQYDGIRRPNTGRRKGKKTDVREKVKR